MSNTVTAASEFAMTEVREAEAEAATEAATETAAGTETPSDDAPSQTQES